MAPSQEPPQLYQSGQTRVRPSSGSAVNRSNYPAATHYQYNTQGGHDHSSGGRPTSSGHSGGQYARYNQGSSSGNNPSMNFLGNGNRGPGVVGSGYQTGSTRPRSAGATRSHSSKHRTVNPSSGHSNVHHQGSHGSTGVHGQGQHGGSSSSGGNDYGMHHNPQVPPTHSSSRGSGSGGSASMRPKSAGAIRKSSGSDPHAHLREHRPDGVRLPDPSSHSNPADVATTRLWSATPASASGGTSKPVTQTSQDPNHWSSSYKQHFAQNAGSSGGVAPVYKNPMSGQAQQQAQQAGVNKVPMQTHINLAEAMASKQAAAQAQVQGEKPSRVRSAIQESQKFTVGGTTDIANKTANDIDDCNSGIEAAIDTENRGGDGDDDDFEGKRVPSSILAASQETRSHPEVSLTTPSQSTVLVGALEGGVDTRNGSMDSFHEDKMSVGLSTVPNQFCSAREALELKKLLVLSNGSRGGIVPSSTAVMDMYMVGKVIGVGSYGKVRAAWHRLTGGKVAIKTYDKSKLKDPAHWKRVHSEIKIT